MALEATFRVLAERVCDLHSSCARIETYYEDRPKTRSKKRAATDLSSAGVEPYPVQRLGDTLVELSATVDEALKAAHDCLRQAEESIDLDRLRRGLMKCQQSISQVEDRVIGEMCDYFRLKELHRSLRKSKGEWSAWSVELVPSLCAFREPLRQASLALVACWQEIAERAGLNSVSVRSTGIGRVHLRAPRGLESERAP
jgi:hypothetical protein